VRVLGRDYLEELLIHDSEPDHFLDDEANPLRKWLLSAMVDQHVVQALEHLRSPVAMAVAHSQSSHVKQNVFLGHIAENC